MSPAQLRWIGSAVLLLPALLWPTSHARACDLGCEGASIESLDRVGAGELLRSVGEVYIPMPVQDVRIDLSVNGLVVHGIVTQTFVNGTEEVIDALYVFPLPEGAAVHAMEIRIGERRIVAVVKEREEARAVYETARREGKKASLVEQERPNLFRTAVANVNPGEEVSVRLEYVEEISYRDGELSLAVPLTFTPRYAPTTASAQSGREPILTQGLAVFPLARIEVRIADGLPVEAIRSSSHDVRSAPSGSSGVVVEPRVNPVIADRDFILSWRIRRTSEPGVVAFVEDRPDGRYALVMVVPPVESAAVALPTDTVFVVDVSGSMEGPSIAAARQALLAAVDRLRPGDAFDILKFDHTNEAFAGTLQPVDSTTLFEAREWIQALAPAGGTEIVPALVRGLEMIRGGASSHAKRVVLITDGAVSNEVEAFETVSSRIGEARLHVIGIGNAPNRYLMRKLAVFGRGAVEFIDARSDVGARMSAFLEGIERPVLTEVALDFLGTAPLESFPQRLPDLHAGEPLVVSMKLDPAHPDLHARLGGRGQSGWIEKEVTIATGAPIGSGIAIRWARAKVESLIDSLHEEADPARVRAEVIDVAMVFHLVTPYTSLVAVEDVATAERRPPDCTLDGSGPMCGLLPQGGTSGPLMLLVGLLLLAAGGALLPFALADRSPVR
jgi:Ca-activated chloride channel family protein